MVGDDDDDDDDDNEEDDEADGGGGAKQARAFKGGYVKLSGEDDDDDDDADAEASSGSVKQLMVGHNKDEVWGLAVHPTDPNCFVTTGDDHTCRVWDAATRTLKRIVLLDTIPEIADLEGEPLSRAAAFSPDGSRIAVGLGGRVGRRGAKRSPGGIALLDSETLELVSPGACKPREAWVSDVKFSPDGLTVAVGAHDSKVELLDATLAKPWWGPGGRDPETKRKLRPLGRCKKSSSYITHFDFSADGSVLQTNDGDYELLYYDVARSAAGGGGSGKSAASIGKHRPDGASAFRDTDWATWTCVLGWPVQRIWPGGADGTDINACARSGSGDLLATSDDFGKVTLFRYPVVHAPSTPAEGSAAAHAAAAESRRAAKGDAGAKKNKKKKRGKARSTNAATPGDLAANISVSGHCSHVTNVRFSVDDSLLLSTGGNDRCVMQWRITRLEDTVTEEFKAIAAENAKKAAARAESAAAAEAEESKESAKPKRKKKPSSSSSSSSSPSSSRAHGAKSAGRRVGAGSKSRRGASGR
eukprot:g4425.t1